MHLFCKKKKEEEAAKPNLGVEALWTTQQGANTATPAEGAEPETVWIVHDYDKAGLHILWFFFFKSIYYKHIYKPQITNRSFVNKMYHTQKLHLNKFKLILKQKCSVL